LPEPLIRVEDLHFAYDQSHPVLAGIDLQIARGEFVALIGENGAGKTTLAKHLNATLKPSHGRVVVCEIDTRSTTVGELARRVGYCYQNPDHQIFCATVREEIEFGALSVGKRREEVANRLTELLEVVGLTQSLEAYPFSLSRGERQKLAVASILAMEPEILVIDEPTTGLDWRGGLAMMDLMARLNQRDHTLVVITHDMRLVAEYARRVVVLAQGRVVADDTPRGVFANHAGMAQARVQPRQITRLFQSLPAEVSPRTILTIDEAADVLQVGLRKARSV
jgi:energy-coupling factor transporter ATP-binding protein EcfA2